jgi:hypothetical protein
MYSYMFRDSMFARSVSKLQKDNLKNSFEIPVLPEGFESGDEPTPEIGFTCISTITHR